MSFSEALPFAYYLMVAVMAFVVLSRAGSEASKGFAVAIVLSLCVFIGGTVLIVLVVIAGDIGVFLSGSPLASGLVAVTVVSALGVSLLRRLL